MIVYAVIETWGFEPGLKSIWSDQGLAEEERGRLAAGSSPLNYIIEEHEVQDHAPYE